VPEVFKGIKQTEASDVDSFGMIMWISHLNDHIDLVIKLNEPIKTDLTKPLKLKDDELFIVYNYMNVKSNFHEII
jgi:hypothetical protein